MRAWHPEKQTERLISIIRRGHVTRNTSGAKYRVLHVQDWVDTDRQDIPHLQNAGFVSHAGKGRDVEVLTVDVDADPSHSVAVVVAAEKEPDVEEGEAIHYAPAKPANQIRINENGICIEAQGQDLLKILIDAFTAANPALGGVLTQQITQLQIMRCGP